MKVSVRSNKTGIVVKRLGKNVQTHKSGTVVMKGVHFGQSLMGEVLEESERQIQPRMSDGMFTVAVKNWSQARYVRSLGGYYNVRTGQRVVSAEYVYMVGSNIYYL